MKIGLFIPCYINAIYPGVGVASYKLLTSLGLDVDYPLDQTCCGQPMANAGFEKDSTELAKRMEGLFEKYDYVVGPSASCVVFVMESTEADAECLIDIFIFHQQHGGTAHIMGEHGQGPVLFRAGLGAQGGITGKSFHFVFSFAVLKSLPLLYHSRAKNTITGLLIITRITI